MRHILVVLALASLSSVLACSSESESPSAPQTDTSTTGDTDGDASVDDTTLDDTSESDTPDTSVGDDSDTDDGDDVVTCDPASCDDLDPCNGVEQCVDGACAEGEVPEDGEACGSSQICVAGVCVNSRCGDGVVDPAQLEICDDGNDVAGDGCEPTCVPTCTIDDHCDNGLSCDGVETCDIATGCQPGTPLDDGTSCGDALICRAGSCVDIRCGDGELSGDEVCDDGNDTNGDGCDNDCTFSCEVDDDCADRDRCTFEACDVATHTCLDGVVVSCDDDSDCTIDSCDPAVGCVNMLIDSDGDGHASTMIGDCGTDCDDTDPALNPDIQDICDGVDNDCDGELDEAPVPWYPDCDMDGFAAAGERPTAVCDQPTTMPRACRVLGSWTQTAPTTAETTDCNDASANVFPGQTAYFDTPVPRVGGFDYNCDGVEDPRYTTFFEADCDIYWPACLSSDAWDADALGGEIPPCGETGVTDGETNTLRCSQYDDADYCWDEPGLRAQACH